MIKLAHQKSMNGCITYTRRGWSRIIFGISYDKKENMRSITVELIFASLAIGWIKDKEEK